MSAQAVAVSFSGVPDEEIVRRTLAGDTAVFEILVRRHNQRLFRAAYAIVRDQNEAEDVMQEAYVRAFAHLEQFEARASFATWLTRIAVHEALARVRRRGRIELREDMAPLSSARNPEQQAVNTELKAALERAIHDLPDIYRHVFVLRAVEGMTGAETAACLDLTEETVKTRLHRARSLLRRRLWKRFGAARREAFAFLGERCDRVTAAVMRRVSAQAKSPSP